MAPIDVIVAIEEDLTTRSETEAAADVEDFEASVVSLGGREEPKI